MIEITYERRKIYSWHNILRYKTIFTLLNYIKAIEQITCIINDTVESFHGRNVLKRQSYFWTINYNLESVNDIPK